MTKTKKVIIAYIPVLHEGYRNFFSNNYDAEELFILGKDVSGGFKQLTKDIRALSPELIQRSIIAWKIFKKVTILDLEALKSMSFKGISIVMPDEDVMNEIKESYLNGVEVKFDSIFLRWDKHKSTENKPIEADQMISSKRGDQEIVALLRKEAGKSSDWWRHVASAIVKDGKIILVSHNKHVPSEQMPYINGDPRADFQKGVNIDLSTAIHSESSIIAEAAKKGISLNETAIYVTTFPCPACAKLIAYSGINKLYYADGYGVLDGESILKANGVKIIFVEP